MVTRGVGVKSPLFGFSTQHNLTSLSPPALLVELEIKKNGHYWLVIDGIIYNLIVTSGVGVGFLLSALDAFEGRKSAFTSVDEPEEDEGCGDKSCASCYDQPSDLINDEQGQDVAEYAVMLAVILVIALGTIHLIGAKASDVFSQIGSKIQ